MHINNWICSTSITNHYVMGYDGHSQLIKTYFILTIATCRMWDQWPVCAVLTRSDTWLIWYCDCLKCIDLLKMLDDWCLPPAPCQDLHSSLLLVLQSLNTTGHDSVLCKPSCFKLVLLSADPVLWNVFNAPNSLNIFRNQVCTKIILINYSCFGDTGHWYF